MTTHPVSGYLLRNLFVSPLVYILKYSISFASCRSNDENDLEPSTYIKIITPNKAEFGFHTTQDTQHKPTYSPWNISFLIKGVAQLCKKKQVPIRKSAVNTCYTMLHQVSAVISAGLGWSYRNQPPLPWPLCGHWLQVQQQPAFQTPKWKRLKSQKISINMYIYIYIYAYKYFSLYYITLYYIILYYTISYHIILYYIISYYIIL